jgi:thymidylate kinase
MLSILQDLFSGFHKNNISYCHWKSNEHLEAGLNGKTDLDILIDRSDFFKLNRILLDLNYIRCKTISYLDYFSIEDFIGFDYPTGSLVHVHLHYELILGRKFIKAYHLPLEEKILEGRILDDRYHVYTINPEFELLLLFIRRALKGNFLNSDEKKEYHWLLEKLKPEKLIELAGELIDDKFTYLIKACLESGLDEKSFRLIKKSVIKRYKYYSLYSKSTRDMYYLAKKFLAALNYLKHKYFHLPLPYRRGIKTGGTIIAFLGVDGAGKSTLIKEMDKWLSWKLDVQRIYFGSGNGPSSFLRLPLKLIARLRVRLRGNVVDKGEKEYTEKRKSALYRIARVLWALSLALEKRKKFKRMWQARTRGLIVLCDRYPQTQYAGFNDGPLLRDWCSSNNRLMKWLSDWEYEIYSLSSELTPDVLIKLMIPLEVAVERKKDIPLFRLRQKIELVNELEFIPSTRVFSVNTDRNKEETILELKQIIWSVLNG